MGKSPLYPTRIKWSLNYLPDASWVNNILYAQHITATSSEFHHDTEANAPHGERCTCTQNPNYIQPQSAVSQQRHFCSLNGPAIFSTQLTMSVRGDE